MNIRGLQTKLNELGIPQRDYSINGDVAPDTYVLNKVYTNWECFYVDERGGQNILKEFDTENEACVFFYNLLKNEMKL